MQAGGVLRDHAFKLYRGTIDFKWGAKGAVGNEKEDVLLLSNDVVNQTIPLILCAEGRSVKVIRQAPPLANWTMSCCSTWRAAA